MGNTTGLVLFYVGYAIFSMIIITGIYAVDPCSNLLISNGEQILAQNSTMSNQFVNTGSSYTCADGSTHTSQQYQFQNTIGSNIPNRGTTGDTASTGFTLGMIFPDWLNSGFQWMLNTGRFLINIVGAPFTILSSFFGSNNITAAFGYGLSLLNIFILVNWITGKDS